MIIATAAQVRKKLAEESRMGRAIGYSDAMRDINSIMDGKPETTLREVLDKLLWAHNRYLWRMNESE